MELDTNLPCVGGQKCVLPPGIRSYDFTVLVEDTSFLCHRSFLRSYSEFFKVLLRVKMKENLENSVKLGGMTADTFHTIMKYIYSQEACLTADNVVDIWYASDQLQIQCLTDDCNDFVCKNLTNENYYIFYQHAKWLNAVCVLKVIEKFMVRNFETFKKTSTFLELSADDLYRLVQNHRLNVKSEELLLESVLGWIKYIPEDSGDICCGDELDVKFANLQVANVRENDQNEMKGDKSQITPATANESPDPVLPEDTFCSETENGVLSQEEEATPGATQKSVNGSELTGRFQHLKMLISGVRLHLVSLEILDNLLKEDYVYHNRQVFDIVLESIFYHLRVERRHGPWPEAAIYRDNSSMDHVMIFGFGRHVRAYSFTTNTIRTAAQSSQYASCQNICVFDNTLYISEVYQKLENKIYHNCNRLMVYSRSRNLSNIMDNSINISPEDHLLIHEKYIYHLDTTGQVHQYCPLIGYEKYWHKRPKIDISFRITLAIIFERYILCFGESSSQACARCYDIKWNKSWDMSRLEGPMNNIVSFSDDKDTYLLQRNGVLTKILNTEPSSENFKCVSELWSFEWDLYGAVLFRGELFIFGKTAHVLSIFGKTHIRDVRYSPTRMFKKLILIFIDSNTKCWPMVLPKVYLK